MAEALNLLNSQLETRAAARAAESYPAILPSGREMNASAPPISELVTEETSTGVQDTLFAIPLIARLCEALHKQGVGYCHWKSNWKLERWMKGEGDLDLLVDRADAERFTSVLSQLGFKQALTSRDRDVPGILNFYGFDAEAGKFVHLHVHYQLVLGHDLTKNFRLPIEKPYLESADGQHLLPTPAPELELIVFVLRMVLKYTASEAILRKVLRKSPPLSTARKELEYLEARSDRARVLAVIKEHLPLIDASFFDACVQSLRAGGSAWERAAVKRQLKRRLKAHGRRPQLADTLLKPGRQIARTIRERVFHQSSRKRLVNGGAIIALVGGDGAGKTTSIKELSRWLSKKFVVKRFHLGKPPRSPLTLIVLVALRTRRLFNKHSETHAHANSVNGGGASSFPGYLQLLRWVCAGRDRRRLYMKARRFATNGGISICDRFPVSQLHLMDGPNINHSIDPSRMNRVVKFLLKAETRYYRQIMPPDMLFVLRVAPEIAVRRKTNEKAAHVRTRSRELWEADWQGTRAHIVDAGQPIEDVVARLQSLIWAEL